MNPKGHILSVFKKCLLLLVIAKYINNKIFFLICQINFKVPEKNVFLGSKNYFTYYKVWSIDLVNLINS